MGGLSPVVLPLIIAAVGVVFSIVGTWFVRIKDENGSPQKALNKGNFGAIILTALASHVVIHNMLPMHFDANGIQYTSNDIFLTVVIGLVVGTLMSLITEFYTALGGHPVRTIAQQSISGSATNIISGLSVGMISTALPILVLAGGIIASFAMAGIYGVAIAASGMMATTGIQLAIDAFGPIADNAGGIAEMAALPKEVRGRTDVLDTVGNTTAAIGKGFAIASAALTSLALFAAFKEITGVHIIDISEAKVLAGLFIGGMVPFLFSALAMRAVGRAANAMVVEVRRQFRDIIGLLEGKEGVEPDYDKCIQISTSAALKLMLLPGLLAIITPIIMGFVFGAEVLAATLAGVAVSGVLMAIFQSNAGGAWDNAKKSFEKGVEIDGKMYYKGSEPHKAAITGDTVGDPFKDTSGPSMNILIKLTAIVSLVIAPLLKTPEVNKGANEAGMASSGMSATTPSADLKNLNGDYVIDVYHSFIDFSVRHFISSAHGTLSADTGIVHMTGNLATSSIYFVLNAGSLSTSNANRDAKMKSASWFATDSFPKVTFRSNSFEENGKGEYKYSSKGDLTMKGVTKPVTIYFKYIGEKIIPAEGDQPETHLQAFEGETTINRNDFNIGKPNIDYLGDEVKVQFSIEANK
jgi:polyisoprenoid-binding protein YceI